jgi:thymidylate synthase
MRSYTMQPYDDALEEILKKGVARTNKRTKAKTRSIFGMQRRYRIDERFPVITRRKVWPKSIFAELLWFLSGSTNNNALQELGSNIWTPWVDREFEQKHGYVEGSLGMVYGYQLRHFGGFYGDGSPIQYEQQWGDDGEGCGNIKRLYGEGGFDQLLYMVNRIKEDPSCRRILFSLWNPLQMDGMRLPPCHYSYQIFIDDEGRMSGMLTQRSCDVGVGGGQNISFYSALTMMLAQQTGYKAYEFIHSIGDAHVYFDQFVAMEEYLVTPIIDSPVLKLNKAPDILSYKMEDFVLENFRSGPKIEIPVAI